jgi:hypothetical protein
MPYATISRDEVIDHVVALDEIPALLATLVPPRVGDPGGLVGSQPAAG